MKILLKKFNFNLLILWIFGIYFVLGWPLYKSGFFTGKTDDLLLSLLLFFYFAKAKITKNIFFQYLAIGAYMIIYFAVTQSEYIGYWFYLYVIWLPVLFFKDEIFIVKKKTVLFIFYLFFLSIYFILGSSGAKEFNIDVNVLHMFFLLCIYIFILKRNIILGASGPLLTLINGVRSSIFLFIIMFRRNTLMFVLFLSAYLFAYFYSLIYISDSPANIARYHLLLNHLANLSNLDLQSILFGAGPQAYKDFDLLISTDVGFVTSKPKTVDSSILRIFLEFGVLFGSYLFYLIYKFIGDFKYFIVYIIAFGLSNEGILSSIGVLSLILIRQELKHFPSD